MHTHTHTSIQQFYTFYLRLNTHPNLWCSNRHRMRVKPLQSHQVQASQQGCVRQRTFPIIPDQTTYRTSPHRSCRRSRCRSRTASGPGRSGCSCSGTDKAHTFSHLPHRDTRAQRRVYTTCKSRADETEAAYRTPPWAHPSRRHSRPRRRTSNVQGCSDPSPYSGTRPHRTSSELQNERGGGGGGGGRSHAGH